jgi:hypothetical protein
VATTNAQLQKIVEDAKRAAVEGRAYDAVSALVQVTAIAAVQQIDLASSINQLAAKVASDPSINIAAEASRLETVGAGGRSRGRGRGACNALLDRSTHTHSTHTHTVSLPACPQTNAPQQAYSGTNLDNMIQAKVTGMPDIVQQITEQQGSLGKTPDETAAAVRHGANSAGVIAGTVVGFGVALGLVVLALVALHRRRSAGAAGAKAAAGAGGSGDDEGHAADGAGPVAEGAERPSAESYYQRRALRAQAALQPQPSPDGNAKSK